MKKSIKFLTLGILLTTGFILAFAIKQNTKTTSSNQGVYTNSINKLNSGKQLLETKCNICHGLKEDSKSMLAPPFVNIKSKYKAVYKTKDKFVKGIVDFTLNPTKEKAMMMGSLKRFAVMPKLGYSKADLTEIANYIYANKFEKPSWFNK